MAMGVNDTGNGNNTTYGDDGGRANATGMCVAPQRWAWANKAVRSGKLLAYVHRPMHKTTTMTTTLGTARMMPGTATNDNNHNDDARYSNVLRAASRLGRQRGCNEGANASMTKATAPTSQEQRRQCNAVDNAGARKRQCNAGKDASTTRTTQSTNNTGNGKNDDKHDNNAHKYCFCLVLCSVCACFS